MFDTHLVPREIWMQIFREASTTTGSLDPIVHSQFDKFRQDIEDDYLYSLSMSTKWSLMLVCKQWFPFVAELFYEDARPKFLYQFNTFKRRLTIERNLSIHPRGYGWWTKKLVIPNNPEFMVDQFVYHIFDVIPFLLNLEILIYPWPLYVTISEFEELMSRLRGIPSLRYLHCRHTERSERYTDDRATPPYATITYLDSVITHLAHSPPFLPTQLTYLALSVYIPSRAGPMWANWHFPTLRHLSLSNVSTSNAEGPLGFVTLHSDTLRSLTLELYGRDSTSSITDEDFLRPCGSLTEFILLHTMASSTVTSFGVYPSVISLGITAKYWANSRIPLKVLYNISRFPNLRRLRVVDDIGSSSLVQEMCDAFPRSERGNVRLEDARGRELEDAREGLGLIMRTIPKGFDDGLTTDDKDEQGVTSVSGSQTSQIPISISILT